MATKLKEKLYWSESIRAIACMLPMLVAAGMGKSSTLVALGQAGFFFGTIPLSPKIGRRLFMGSIFTTIGLGLYLIGGNVAQYFWVSLFFTFFIAWILGLMSGWKLTGPLVLTMMVVYTAGLNSFTPEKATSNFFLFAFALTWGMLISLLPIWRVDKPLETPEPSDLEIAEQGFKMGIGTSIALAFANLLGQAKLGWAPSAVANVVRYDTKTSKRRAWARALGTLGGAIIAGVSMFITKDLTILMLLGAFYAFLNGLFKRTVVGMMPLFYTATILILYSLNDLSDSNTLITQRIIYNFMGIIIGMLIVLYPFPYLFKKLEKVAKESNT